MSKQKSKFTFTPDTVRPAALGLITVGIGHSVAFGEPAAVSSLAHGFNIIAGGAVAGFGAWVSYEGACKILGIEPR